eukprot:753776-Hanusia_phi.AAC.3
MPSSEKLRRLGASVGKISHEGKSALMYAAESNNTKVVRVLLQVSSSPPPPCSSLRHRRSKRQKALLSSSPPAARDLTCFKLIESEVIDSTFPVACRNYRATLLLLQRCRGQQACFPPQTRMTDPLPTCCCEAEPPAVLFM